MQFGSVVLSVSDIIDAIREVEQRIKMGEAGNHDLAVPERPVGVPRTFREYAEVMFDLQVLAFQADIARVTTFMMARENINRSYPEIGLPEAHHAMSHHENNPKKMKAFSKLNTSGFGQPSCRRAKRRCSGRTAWPRERTRRCSA